MRKPRFTIAVVLAVLLSSIPLAGWSQSVILFSPTELDEILGPIALYPDPLLAQILPAATFPDQLSDASRFVSRGGSTYDVDSQYWDLSVRAIAHYPYVLNMLVDKPDWTTALGQAYVNQPDAVMDSIQRLRSRARSYGYLSSNRYETVYDEYGAIRIVPIQPEYIYVPQYDPGIVYVQRRNSFDSNAISFVLGFLIGSFLDRDIDFRHHHRHIFYHGWNGGGWIARSRQFVSTNDRRYVNDRFANRSITVDPRVRDRDIRGYRDQVRRDAGRFRSENYPRSVRRGPSTPGSVGSAGPTIQNRGFPSTGGTRPGYRGNRGFPVPSPSVPSAPQGGAPTFGRNRTIPTPSPSVPSNPQGRRPGFGRNRTVPTPGPSAPTFGRNRTIPAPGESRPSFNPPDRRGTFGGQPSTPSSSGSFGRGNRGTFGRQPSTPSSNGSFGRGSRGSSGRSNSGVTSPSSSGRQGGVRQNSGSEGNRGSTRGGFGGEGNRGGFGRGR